MKNKDYPYYDVPEMSDLKEMVWNKAKTAPNKTAFVYPCETGEMKKSYQDMKDDVNAFGTWMYSENIKGKHVAIIGENSYEWLVAFLAATNGGNVAVAIDKNLPEEEQIALAEIGEVDIFLVTDSYVDKVAHALKPGDSRKVIDLIDFNAILKKGRKLISQGEEEFLNYEVVLDQTAAILFTSGTSGVSKGVELSHRNMAYDVVHTSMLYQPDLNGGVVAILPFHHAFGLVVAVFMVFNYGVPIYINKKIKMIKKDMEEFRPQLMFMVPMFVEFFHKQIWKEIEKKGKTAVFRHLMNTTDALLKTGIDVRGKTYKTVQNVFGGKLEYIICGGAALDPMYVKDFRSWGIEILNGYGTTECAPCVAVNRPYHYKDGSVGKLVPGLKVKVSDEGEIAFKGDVVMKGYYKKPEDTEKVLVDGWYYTGDLGYVDDEDFIFLTGRKKNLIILSNGENISPEELEQNIARDPGVQEVLVYDENSKIVAEIFPTEEYLGNEEYFEALKDKVNKGRPIYKQITKVRLREEEFIKNASMKIIRHKNIPSLKEEER